MRRALFILATLVPLTARAETQTQPLSTPRGAPVEMLVDWPDGRFAPPFPTLVLASGQAYHQRLPLQAELARALSAQGIAVLRFDWAYQTRKGQSSTGLVEEREDMAQVLAWARAQPSLDARRLAIGGKSLGTMVAWPLFVAEPSLRALVQLTPLCSRPAENGLPERSLGDARYPGFATHRHDRPVLFVLGDRDPGCQLQHLRMLAPEAVIAEVGGDHSLKHPRLEADAGEAAHQRSLQRAASAVAAFLAEALK